MITDTLIETLVTDEAAVSKLAIEYNGRQYVFDGWAKKHPKDEPNIHIGEALSLARALHEAAEFFATQAECMVEENCFNHSARVREILEMAYEAFGSNTDPDLRLNDTEEVYARWMD